MDGFAISRSSAMRGSLAWCRSADLVKHRLAECEYEHKANISKRVRLFGRHNTSRGATFVAMVQTTNLRELIFSMAT